MTASPRTGAHVPIIAWIGDPPPVGVTDSLAAIADVRTGWTTDAEIITVWAPMGTDSLRDIPGHMSSAPVIATVDHDPSPAERMSWIKAGAEDLVSLAALPIAVARRLKRLCRERDSAARQGQHAPPQRDPTSIVEPLLVPGGAEGVTPPPTAAIARPKAEGTKAARARRTIDEDFPPLRLPRPAAGIPPGIRRWADALDRYLEQRDAWVARWGPGGLERLLELAHLRDQIPVVRENERGGVFGRVDAGDHTGLGWSVLVRRGPSRGRKGIAVSEGVIVAVGTDGLCVALSAASSPGQKLVMDIAIDEDTNAQFLVQARWQRRLNADQWMLGAVVLEVRTRALSHLPPPS